MHARIFSVLASVFVGVGAALAQSTEFTYQGEITLGGAPTTGVFDVRFKLFDVAVGGTEIASNVCSNNVLASNGKFTTTLDFGQSFVSSAARFIEIEVRTDTGLDCASAAGFVVLAPRQRVTAAPLATHAKSAFSLAAADGSPSNAVVVDNNGLVGVGTTTPTHSLHIASTGPTLALQDTDSSGASGGQQVGYLSYRDSGNVERAWIGFGSVGDPDFSIVSARLNGDIVLSTLGGGAVRAHAFAATSGGSVGIGTTAPASALDVRGDIRLGPSGQYRAVAGEENLRIIRGAVNNAGVIVRGTGFTATRLEEGKYRVTFNTPFASTPTVTATCDRFTIEPFIISFDFGSPTATQVTFVTGSSDNGFLDQGFNFIAIGPR